MLDAIKSSISDYDKILLNALYTYDEVKAALDTMYFDKAPSPDGMTTFFYKKHWHY